MLIFLGLFLCAGFIIQVHHFIKELQDGLRMKRYLRKLRDQLQRVRPLRRYRERYTEFHYENELKPAKKACSCLNKEENKNEDESGQLAAAHPMKLPKVVHFNPRLSVRYVSIDSERVESYEDCTEILI